MRERVIIVGGGVAGYPAALRASRLGAEVTLIEKELLGGVCLHKGCIPTKVYLEAISILKEINKAKLFGINLESIDIDFGSLSQRRRTIINRLKNGVENLLRAKKVRIVNGTASFIDSNNIKVLETGEVITGDKFILATGSIPSELPISGSEKIPLLTSDDLLNLESLPKSILIIGGGYIGVELGQFFHHMGVEVSILEIMNRIVPTEDEEISQALKGFLEKEGIKIFVQSKVESIEKDGNEKKVTFVTPDGKRGKNFSEVVQTIGRKPWFSGLGIERIGLETENERIVVNDRMETNIPHIFAAGDVTGGIMLAHKAIAEGECAARNALGYQSKISKFVPKCIYTIPEVASVGMTEKEARERGEVEVSHFPFHAIGKASIMEETQGMIKIISGKKYGEILGVHIIGKNATELIGEIVLAMEMEATLEELAHIIHPHPTLSEGLSEAAMVLRGGAIHLP